MFLGQPITPDQLARLRGQIAGARDEVYGGAMPTTMGEGLQRFGTAVGMVAMQHRLKSQFPAAPPPPTGQPVPLSAQVARALGGNQAPSQFPAAPAPPPDATQAFPAAPAAPQAATVFASPRAADAGLTSPVAPQKTWLFGNGGIFGMKPGGLY